MERRTLIKTSLLSAGGVAAMLQGATPGQPEGPFHPVNIDNDLRRRSPSGPFAAGEQIEVRGTVVDSVTHQPIAGAIIDIWQADRNGKYSHPNDPLPVTPDPHFQFYGRAYTDAAGGYRFFTIKPGSYPADANWTRPPHIHFLVRCRGYLELTTQMYFAGEDELNRQDRLLRRLAPAEQRQLVVSFQPQNNGLALGRFSLELDPI